MTRQYNLVLLDVEMPGMSGLEVLEPAARHPLADRAARHHGHRQGTERDIVEALGLGANDYVTKPVDFPVALARIDTHLSHKWAVEDLHESEERYALAVRGANDGLWDWNSTTNEVYWSPRWKACSGTKSRDRQIPEEWLSRIHHEDRRVKETLEAHLASGSGHYESEHRILHRDGTYRWVRCRGAAVRDARAGDAARRLADRHHRREGRRCVDRAAEPAAVRRSARAGDQASERRPIVFALLVLGLDRFKVVNQSLGRADARTGCSWRWRGGCKRACAKPTSSRGTGGFTLARLGGDEFTVLLDDITDASDAIRVAERFEPR